MLHDLIPALRASLRRLECLEPQPADSPIAELRLASLLQAQAALLSAIAGELETRAHDDLGRFGAEVVQVASQAADPETAACEVAGAFLRLHAFLRQNVAVTPPRIRLPMTDPPNSWNRC